MTLEGWAYLMYAVQDGYNYYASAAFFVVVILFGSFFVINLFVAVIYDAFMQHMQQGSMRREGEGAVDETPAQAAVGRLSRRLSSISAEEIARVLQEDGRDTCSDGRSSVLSAVPEDRSKRTSVPATAWVETGGAGSLRRSMTRSLTRRLSLTSQHLHLPRVPSASRLWRPWQPHGAVRGSAGARWSVSSAGKPGGEGTGHDAERGAAGGDEPEATTPRSSGAAAGRRCGGLGLKPY